MTIQDIVKRAQDRWEAGKSIPLPDVELIRADRLTTPLVGEKLVKKVRVSELAR